MNNEIRTYSIGVVIQPKPALLLTYSYLNDQDKRRKRLMPVRDLNKISNLDELNDLDNFQEIIKRLKEHHSPYLNEVNNLLLIKVLIILCGLIDKTLELDQCLSNAERLLKIIESKQESSIKQEEFSSSSSVEENEKINLDKNDDKKMNKSIDKTIKRQVHFKDGHDEFIFERFDSEDNEDLIDDLNDKHFLDSMFKNELNYEEDLNNNYQEMNFNRTKLNSEISSD